MKKSWRWSLVLFIGWLFFAWSTGYSQAAADSSQPAQIIRVGWYPAAGLQDGTTPDDLSGFNYEYLMRIAQYTNWKYVFVFGDFGDLEQKLMMGDIDIMGDIAKTDARMSCYNYCTYPSCYSHTLLLCRLDDDRFAYNDYSAYDGMVTGNSGSAFRKAMMDRESGSHHFQVQYQDYANDDDMLAALDRGEVDTVLISDAVQNESYKVLHEWEPAAQYFVVNKERADILSDLNRAMENLQSSDNAIQAHLFAKYFGGDNNAFTIALSREEMAAIAEKPVLTVLLAENQKPLSYVEDQQVKGVIPDYLQVLSEKTGLQFRYVLCRDYMEMLRRFESGEGDLCGQIYENYESKGYKIIQSYTTLSCGLVYNPAAVEDLHTVAVESGNMVLFRQLENMGMKPVFYTSPTACLDAVNAKEVDAAAMSNIVFEQIAYHHPYLHLIYKAQSSLNLNLCLGVAADRNPILFGVLSKNTGAIAPDIVARLMLNDTSLKPQYTVRDYLMNNLTFINIILVLLFIIVFLCLWYRRQRRFNACLLKATEAKNSFFNNLSHDLRTPLTGILGYSELAMKTMQPEQKQDYLQKIQTSGMLLLNLINDTLNLARIERDEFMLAPVTIHAKTFFEALLLPIQSQIQQKQQIFDVQLLLPEDEYIAVDKLKFQDMLLNILSNAVKYTPAGGRIEVQVQHIDLPKAAVQYHIRVRDTGIGMSPEFLEHLFEPFMQEQDKRVEGVSGTGLGMSIVKRIIDLMQGKIVVRSVKDQGTQVDVTVPVTVAVKEKKSEEVSTVRPDDITMLQGKRILLCEDNMLNREIITELLTSKGLFVDAAENGQQGLELFSTAAPGTYQAILMDIRMPVMDGYTAASRIRALEGDYARHIPILALSADAYEESIKKSLENGMTAHLSKPIEIDQLFAALLKYILPQSPV